MRKNHLCLLTVFILLCTSIAIAQNPLVKQWDYRFGGTNHEFFSAFRQTADGGYILGGQAKSGISGDKTQLNQDPSNNTYDYWVVKIDSLGIKQWDKDFGGGMDDELIDIQITSDGGYILGGQSRSDAGGDKTDSNWDKSLNSYDYWVVKIDSIGKWQWDRDFGGTGDDEFGSLQQTKDGGYILGGWSSSDISGNKTQNVRGSADYWIVKIDSAGNYQWDKDFGGPSVDRLSNLKQTTDGGYILGGYSYSGIGGDKTEANRSPSNFTWDYWVVKIDSAGKYQWDRDFGGKDDDMFTVVQQTRDKGFILGGYSFSQAGGDKTENTKGATDYWLVKIDSSGAKQWDRDLGGNMGEELADVYQTADNGYFVFGSSYSRMTGDKSENKLGEEQSWVLKTDSLGKKIWDKTIFTKGHDEANRGILSRDGGILVASYGQADSGGYKTQNNWNGSFDYWIVKFRDTSHYCNLASPHIANDKNSFCSNDSAEICAPSGFAAYEWNAGGSNPCLEAKQAGSYYVTVTDNNGCTAESNHMSITVLPVPSVSIVEKGDTLASINAVAYQWYKDGNLLNGDTSSVFIAKEHGSYTVAVTDSNGCSAVSAPVNITGIDELEDEGVWVYPNPSNNKINIITMNFPQKLIAIYDLNGSKVIEEKYAQQTDISALTSGIYFIEIKDAETTVRKKFVKL